MKNRTPASAVILYIFAFVFLVITAFMVWTAVNYEMLYLETMGATFNDMWSNLIQYMIEKCAPCLGITIALFGLASAIRAFAKNRPVIPESTDSAFDEQSPVAVKLEELRQVSSIKLEEMERREKVRLEETKTMLMDQMDLQRMQREQVEGVFMQKLELLSQKAGIVSPVCTEATEPAAEEDALRTAEPAAEEDALKTAETAEGAELAEAEPAGAAEESGVMTPDEEYRELFDDQPAAEAAEEAETEAEEPVAAEAAEEAETEAEEPVAAEAEEPAEEAEETAEAEAAAAAEESEEAAAEPEEEFAAEESEEAPKAESEEAVPEAEEVPEADTEVPEDAETSEEAEAAEAAADAETGEEAEATAAAEAPAEEEPEQMPAWDGKKADVKIIEPVKQHRRKKKKKGNR